MLIIFEMANNHGGSVEHGKRIIEDFRTVADQYKQFEYAFKFQYRDLDTYIHPDADQENEYVKRFVKTNLSLRDRLTLKSHAKKHGFKTACTPFDEKSVRHVAEHEYDILKIGSPGALDMPLLMEVHYGWPSFRPVILSVGGLNEQEIDSAIFTLAREDLILMHCVSEYPCVYAYPTQVGWLMNKYPKNTIGFSSHQDPSEMMFLPYCGVYEFHVCIDPLPNRYSLNPEAMDATLGQLNRDYFTRISGTKPVQFMRKPDAGDVMGRWWWKP